MIYYMKMHNGTEDTAGPKAPNDIYKFTEQLGGKSIEFKIVPNKGDLYRKLWMLTVGISQWGKVFTKLGKGDVFVYQHPAKGTRIANKIIPWIKKIKKAKFVVVIHDLESLRQLSYIYNDEIHKIADNQLLNNFDKIICHNNEMKKYLVEKGIPKEKLVCLEIFDYISSLGMSADTTSNSLAIAGNLSLGKSPYIYKLIEHKFDYKLNLFGPYLDETVELGDKIKYFGSFKPDELPGKLEGKFGLVWDGDSIDTCSGSTGNYLRYNNPHKTSLYLTAGIPVIIWKEAAMAKFIEKHKAGILVESLTEIDDVINNISVSDYTELKNNAVQIGMQLRDGYYYKKALQECIENANSNR